MIPTAFASRAPLDAGDARDAPIRYPRPGRLLEKLQVPGAKAERAAAALGLLGVGDLLEHLPRDRREARAIAALTPGEAATLVVQVVGIRSRSTRRRGMRPLVHATVADGSGQLAVTFFNQPWLVERYPPGTRLVLHGRYEHGARFTVQSHARTAEAPAQAGEVAEVAHYPATEGLSSTQILALVREHAGAFDDVVEPLPASLRARERLAERGAALRAAHFPNGDEDAERARSRLAFEELLIAQLALMARRRGRSSGAAAPRISQVGEMTGRWLESGLPFALTGDQLAAIRGIDGDIERSVPMQRLLMGEVGSGKTVVALYAMLRAVELGLQAALMAPTEVLAEQHFATIQKLLGDEVVRAGLLTGSTPARRRGELLPRLASGELSLIVGTHALIEEGVVFRSLGLVVVDEQHRFGVTQRSVLDRAGADGLRPHMLHMTATPIPRTLALSRYGDLDFTLLRELPAGRAPIATSICASEGERRLAYEAIRAEVRSGHQAFVVCPLVEESELVEARAATVELERLAAGPLRDLRLELLHGQMPAAAKQQAMAAFSSGAADVLVATSVIEVGIDVPNATVMLIEDAERYGISQLHQLRGRIGRGAFASRCLMFGRRDSERLRALAGESDGFALAEVDLRLRGEGELVGTRQHGSAEYKFATLPDDAELLERARLAAERIFAADPELAGPEHALIAAAVWARYGAGPMRA